MQTVDDQVWTQRQQITALTLLTTTGGNGTLIHVLSPAPQDGGSATRPSQWYTKGAGRTARLTFTVAVAAYLKPEFTETVSPQQYWVGTMVEPLTYTLMP